MKKDRQRGIAKEETWAHLPQRMALEAASRTRRAWCLVAWAILAVAGSSCCPSRRSLTQVMPDTGYPRQLMEVDGATLYASVVWDAGLGPEKELYNGLFGTSLFQIPDKATPGPHPVAIRNSLGTSATKQVTVLASQGVFPPRASKTSACSWLEATGRWTSL